MNFIGDYFALGLVLVLFLFFIDSKTSLRHMSWSGKLFIISLVMTALTAVTNLFTGFLLEQTGVSLWENMLANTMYFVIALVTTNFLALYLFRKILEHTHQRHCMRRAYIGLFLIMVIYLIMTVVSSVLLRLWESKLDGSATYDLATTDTLAHTSGMARHPGDANEAFGEKNREIGKEEK